MTLKQYICDKNGIPKRGAISRVSEYLGVSWNCVKRWINGEWIPFKERAMQIQDMIHARIPIAQKKRVRIPRKRNSLRESRLQKY